ncbi:S41 family peptidase [Litorimonas sp. RW-G-Af-16]|uniref:S41 family peptidase n=1 Tax=Litorimonas sp. RW-G-Af-16 TaxID=3241168 RepID=UPI00390CD9DF
MLKNYYPSCLAISVSMLALSACGTSMQARPVADLPPGVAGIWKSNGYGYVLDATEEYPRLFHHTLEFCVEDTDTAALLSYYLTPDNLAYDSEGRAIYFSPTLEDYKIELQSIPRRPQTCGLELASDPLTVFDSFASYMDTHYAFFDLYDVDWKKAAAASRQNISSKTTDGELADILAELIEPIQDAHLSLELKVKGKERVLNPGRSSVGNALRRIAERDGTSIKKLNNQMMQQYWMTDVKKDILNGDGKMMADDMIQFGIVSDNIGYIAIAAEAGYAGKGEYSEDADLAVLNETLDQAISTFNEASAKAVIIDLSVNFGGYDFISRAIAERFAVQPSLAYTKYAADSSNQTPYPISITPYAGSRYTGPVVLVTSNVTVSAGEMLTMALRTQPNVTHVGETTRGAHSDVLEKKLPNGWRLKLSNEVYHDHEGKFWEGRGIPPHVPMQIFKPDNPFEGHVEAILSIIDRIDKGEFSAPSSSKPHHRGK